MGQTTHDTDTLPIAEVADRLSNLVDEVSANDKRIVIERDGVPVATLVSMDDVRRLHALEKESGNPRTTTTTESQTPDAVIAERQAAIRAMRQAFADISPEEIERETAKAVAEVRAEMKAERDGFAQSA